MAKHALISPSAFKRVAYCPASVLISLNSPDETSDYAEEGTRAHEWAEHAARAMFHSITGGDPAWKATEDELAAYAAWHKERVDSEMVDAVQVYGAHIRDILFASGADRVYYAGTEVRLPLTPVTGEPDAFGTADAIVMTQDTLHIVDFKYGKGVAVAANHNAQLSIYALAALRYLDADLYGVTKVSLHIVQPRIDSVTVWDTTAEELNRRFAGVVKRVSARVMELCDNPDLLQVDGPYDPVNPDNSKGDFAEPDEDVCRFCRGKAVCPMLARKLNAIVVQDLPDLEAAKEQGIPVPDTPEALSKAYGYVGMIRSWCDAVEARVRSQLLEWQTVPGYKLVSGRAGMRKWSDSAAAEDILRRALPVAEVYDKKLISPATAEKLVKKGVIGPKYWARLNSLMTRSDTKPLVVETSDPREAIKPKLENDFENLETETLEK